MRIYTRTGDDGETGLFGGSRVAKDHPRIAAYGEVDELNSVLGWCAAALASNQVARMRELQSLLFTAGSHLATPPDAGTEARSYLPAWPEEATASLEADIDAWDEELEPLKSFILPGGSEAAARLHVARTVCRRAERALASLAACGEGEVDERIPVFLNRLSDWLFVFARQVNAGAGVEDIPWQPPRD